MLLDQRQGVDVKIPVAVIKGQHNGPLRKLSRAASQDRGQLTSGDPGEPLVTQVRDLIREGFRRDHQPARRLRRVDNLVVHQDGNPER